MRGSEKIVPQIVFKHNAFLNSFGIQPIFTENNEIIRSDIFYVERYLDYKRDPLGTFKYVLEKDIEKINNSALPYNYLYSRLLVDIVNNSRHFTVDKSIDEFLKLPKTKYKDALRMHCYYLFYNNTFMNGNIFISSNQKLLDGLDFNNSYLHCEKILVPEQLLANNVLLIGAKGTAMADHAVILCPFIDKNLYMEWLDIHGLTDDIKINPKDQFPLLRKWSKIYKHYSAYINENIPAKWYVLKSPKMYNFYTTLIFKS